MYKSEKRLVGTLESNHERTWVLLLSVVLTGEELEA
jgi:hypothetical protein